MSGLRGTQWNIRDEERDPPEVSLECNEDIYILSSPLCRGDVKLEYNGRVVHEGGVRPGMLRVMSPGERVRVTKRTRLRILNIVVPGDEFRLIADERPSRPSSTSLCAIAPLFEPNYQAQHLCAALLAATEFDFNNCQLFVDGLTHSLLAILFNASSRFPDTKKHLGHCGLSDKQLARCLDYADSRLAERLDLKAWAAELGMSTSEFARRFRQTTGLAPYTWFLNWRIDRAKQILIKGNVPVVEIALDVGFCSQSHFTEAFRRRTGFSPGRWRAKHLAERS